MSTVLLAGHDGSSRGDDALAFARVLAGALDARVVVANVLETSPLQGARGRAYDAATERLVEVAEEVSPPDEVRVVEAPTAERGLLALAEDLEAAMLVVGSSHRSVVGQAVLGTVADHVLRDAPCDVVLAPPAGAPERSVVRRIAVAYDGSPNAQAALERAAALAEAIGHGTRVDVLTMIDLTPALVQPGLALVADDGGADRRAAEACAEGGLAALPPELRGETRTAFGLPGEALARAAGELGADLVVCGSRRQGPLRRVLAGSTARRLLHNATCPVLVAPGAGTEV